MKMMDFVYNIEFVNDIKPKLEIKEEPIDMKSSSASIKRKSELMEEEILKVKSSKIDQKSDQVDPIMSKEMLDFAHDIEFTDDVKSKLEIPKSPKLLCDLCDIIGSCQIYSKIIDFDRAKEFHCELCQKDWKKLNMHMAGIKEKEKEHERRIEMSHESLSLDCDLCNVKIPSQLSLNMHMKEYKHKMKWKMLKSSKFHCEICNIISTDQKGLDMHMAGKRHFENRYKRPNFSA